MKTNFAILLILACNTLLAQVKIVNLKCEQLTTPLGIDISNPRLSWQLQSNLKNVKQLNYEIRVASSAKLLITNPNVWQSGIVNSDKSLLIPIGINQLKSNQKYYWSVTISTNKTKAITANSYFTTGLLNQTDWVAKWIGWDKASDWDSISQWSRLSARYIRKEFENKKTIKRATAFVCGLGLYEFFINGKKIGNQVLAPNPTDFRKTVLYNSFDITSNISNGKNAIGVILGNGRFFTMRQNYKTHKHNTFGFPKLKLQIEIEYTDNTKQLITTNESWKINTNGPIRTNNEYDGEEYDATKEFGNWTDVNFNDKNWNDVELVKAPNGILKAQLQESMQIMKVISPKSIKSIGNKKYIIDMGQNFSGFLAFNGKGKKGDTLTLKFAESLQTNGNLYLANLRDAKVTDKYIFKGNNTIENWQPSFVYHGFRYVEVSGLSDVPSLKNFEGKFIYDALQNIGNFNSSNLTVNQIYNNAWWGIASNYKGMPVDCPQRNERQPWLGDRTIGAIGESYVFDNAKLYAKWMQDIEDSQTPEGSIPDVAPAFWNYYTDDVTWPAAFITISNNLYNQFGDIKPIEKHYAAMKKWFFYMKDKFLKDYIMTRDKYGDWCTPPESLELIHAKDSSRITNGQLIATAYYYKLISYMERFAVLLKQENDISQYKELSNHIKVAFQQKYYNSKLKQYDNGTVTANLLPLYFGITPDSIKQTIVDKIRQKLYIESKAHINTGLIGTQWLMRALSEYKMQDLAFTIASNKTYPSWGYMVEQGATTIWELWNGNTANPQMNSQNHVMLLGDLLIWLYENIGGIRTDKTNVGFKKIIMRPTLPVDLQSASVSYNSAYGKINSAWKNNDKFFQWNISIPANTSAIVYFPTFDVGAIMENGLPFHKSSEFQFVKIENGNTIIEIPSGDYNFTYNKKWKKGIEKSTFIFERTSFPESHAATIVETPKGLLAAWFGGTKEGNKDVCIWTSNFVNNKWTAPKKVADGLLNDSTRFACYNPVLFQIPNGQLLLFYKVGPNVARWKGFMKKSDDNGATWSDAKALPDSFLGPIKNKPILVNDVLLCPSSTEKNGWMAHIEFLNINTNEWTKTNAINDGKLFSAIQPSILTYKDGRMQIICRSRNLTLNESWSADNGKTWNAMAATNMPNNNSGTDAVTLLDGRQLLVYNHAMPDSTWVKGKGPRTPLNVAISSDGVNWNAVAILEDSPISQYSYPSVIQSKDGLVHIVYTWRRERIKHVVIDLSKIEVQPIKNGKWPGAIANNGITTDD
jgi:alpha-L-rhamnosidase